MDAADSFARAQSSSGPGSGPPKGVETRLYESLVRARNLSRDTSAWLPLSDSRRADSSFNRPEWASASICRSNHSAIRSNSARGNWTIAASISSILVTHRLYSHESSVSTARFEGSLPEAKEISWRRGTWRGGTLSYRIMVTKPWLRGPGGGEQGKDNESSPSVATLRFCSDDSVRDAGRTFYSV